MAKQREVVEKQFHGRAKNENYDREMERARVEDQASYGTVPVQRNAAVDAWFDQHCSCTGCCSHDEDNPENNSSCCIIM